MKNIKYVLFDLDGTLTDPGEGITNSVAFALQQFGIPVQNKTELYKFIGPPLIDSFVKYYNFSAEQAKSAVNYYRKYYTPKGIFENKLYSGIDKLLQSLTESDKKILLATSKPEPFAVKILELFGIKQYFHFVAGSTMDETRTEKELVIEYALAECGITDRSSAIMIGDRKYDIDGAHKQGLQAIGVLYGYGSKQELKNAAADYIVQDVADLEKLLIT